MESTREEGAITVHALEKQVGNVEFYRIAQAWHDSVLEQFGIAMTEHQTSEAWRFIQSMNLNPLKHETYNAARHHLVNMQLLPESVALTCRETLEKQLRLGVLTPSQFVKRCHTYELQGVLDAPRSRPASSIRPRLIL